MTTIEINDLQKADYSVELELKDIDLIKGGAIWVPVAFGVAAGTAFVAGFGHGISLYNSTKGKQYLLYSDVIAFE